MSRSRNSLTLAAEGAAWQPIATAPKDGTPILLARWAGEDDDAEIGPDAGVVAHWAHWPDHQGWYVLGFGTSDEGHRSTGNGELDDNGYPEDLGPTHWLRLPPPPPAPSISEERHHGR